MKRVIALLVLAAGTMACPTRYGIITQESPSGRIVVVQAPDSAIPIYVDSVPGRPLRVTVPPVYARPGDLLNWVVGDPDHGIDAWAVHFPAPSPVVRNGVGVRRIRPGDGPVRVRDDNPAGKYNYFIAVVVDGKIYTEDPPLIDEGDEKT